MNVHIDQKLKISLEESWLRRIAQKALQAEGVTLPIEMGLVITSAEAVQQLNKTYRGEDEPTDVLAFHMFPQTEQEGEPSFVAPPDGVHHLGEVVISYTQAVQQAREQGHSIEQELALLTVHGVLHLLGWDHEQLEERQRMRAKEEEILTKLTSIRSEE
ncbi:MAG: rRNA maturation RNase YbeY [Dehalococcoidia bacterium]|nr:rRNA maturation RNase YbeY [Dehalococcoidia bacterium]